jgi:hypothetical protein
MAVKEARKKAELVLAEAGSKLGEGVGKARERVVEGMTEGRKVTAKGVARAGAAGRARVEDARKAAEPRLKAARKRAGKGLKRTRRKVGFLVAGEKPPSRKRRIGTGLVAGAAGAAAAFFLDPVSGKRRRHVAKDWIAARARGVARRGGQAGRLVGAKAYGTVQSVRHRRDAGVPENDQVLAHKVESELFQSIDLPTGRINVNAENGLVVLRGQVDRQDDVERIEQAVRTIQGVREVENLLHTPGTPAPTRR